MPYLAREDGRWVSCALGLVIAVGLGWPGAEAILTRRNSYEEKSISPRLRLWGPSTGLAGLRL